MHYNALILNILKKSLSTFGFLLIAMVVSSQNDVVFEATTDAKQVTLDGYFEVSFTLKNANGSQFAPPSFQDFEILAGPSTSSSMQIINGQVSREMSFGFTLQPTKVGKFTIGSASVKANGKTFRTTPISVEVVKGTPKSKASGGEEFFIKVIPNKRTAYIGEQVMLDFKLYTRVAIEGYEIPEDPNYDGFYAVELRRFNSNTVQEVINGQQYVTKVLRRIALFPQQAGKLTIEPFKMQLGVVDDGGRSSSFFFQRSVRPVNFTTDAIQIDVKPLPNDEPSDFCGAVGKYEIQAGLDRKSATTDDAVTLRVVLNGNGDIKRVQPPSLILSDSFEVYEPKMVDEKTEEIRSEIISEKTFEYLILPRFTGAYSLRPTVSYFDSEKGQFVKFSVGPLPLNVKKGTGKPNTNTSNQGTQGLKDILAIKTSANLKKAAIPFVGSWIFWLLLILPVILFTAILSKQKKEKALAASIDPSEKKAKTAGIEAQKRLAIAKQQLQTGDSRVFYDEVSKAYIGYVCDKTGLPLSQLTKENTKEKLSTFSLDEGIVDDFVKIIQTCEVALYAGLDNPASMQTMYEKAVEVISKIEEEIQKRTK
ncbi:MAG: protein BatD [Saprospiraceae bacterium]|nr:protein BatD [Saprospiraceae bacterium]